MWIRSGRDRDERLATEVNPATKDNCSSWDQKLLEEIFDIVIRRPVRLVPPPDLTPLRMTEIALLGTHLRLLFGPLFSRGPTDWLQISRDLFALLVV